MTDKLVSVSRTAVSVGVITQEDVSDASRQSPAYAGVPEVKPAFINCSGLRVQKSRASE